MSDNDNSGTERGPRRPSGVQECSRCGDPAELQYADEWLCPDCYIDEPGAGGHIGTRRETAKQSRKRLRELQTGIQR